MATTARCPAARAPIARAHRRSPARLASGVRVASTPRPLGASECRRAELARRVRPRAVDDRTPSTSAIPDRPIVDLQGKTVLVVGLGCVRSRPVEPPPSSAFVSHTRASGHAPQSVVRSDHPPTLSPELNPAESPVAPPRDSPSRAARTSSASTSTPSARRSRAIPTPSSPPASSPPPPPRLERSAASFAPSSAPTATPPSPRPTSSSSPPACPSLSLRWRRRSRRVARRSSPNSRSRPRACPRASRPWR